MSAQGTANYGQVERMGEHGQSLIPTSAQGCTDVSVSTPLPATAQETLVFSAEISTYHPLVSPVLDSFPPSYASSAIILNKP